MPSLASRFEEVLAQRRSQESTRRNTKKCPRYTSYAKGNPLAQTDEREAEKLQKNLDLLLRRHICESARLTASKDEYDILVALLVPWEGQESTNIAEQSLDPIGRCATGAEHTGIEALNVMETVMKYTRCTLAVIQSGV